MIPPYCNEKNPVYVNYICFPKALDLSYQLKIKIPPPMHQAKLCDRQTKNYLTNRYAISPVYSLFYFSIWIFFQNYFKSFLEKTTTTFLSQNASPDDDLRSNIAGNTKKINKWTKKKKIERKKILFILSLHVFFFNLSHSISLSLSLSLSLHIYIYVCVCCNLTKGYWMRNNQNGGCKGNGNLNIIKQIQ